MKIFARFTALILSVLMLANIAACSEKPAETSQSQTSAVTTETRAQTEQTTSAIASETSEDEETVPTFTIPEAPGKNSEGLMFEAIDKTTAKVTGLGTCTDTKVVIPCETPEGLTVVQIADKAFIESNVTEVIVPETVTSIGNHAFRYCANLTSVRLTDHITSIGSFAFSNCLNLTYFVMPAGITKISNSMFMGDLSLKTIIIPDSVTDIGNFAFRDCQSLNAIDIPEGVTSIGEGAFERCKSLEFVKIPESVIYFGHHAFSSSGLVSLQLDCRLITAYAFYRCRKLEKVVFSDKVVRIECGAFSSCEAIVDLAIPDSVEWIDVGSFANCTSLTTVVVPQETVGNNKSEVFGGCKGVLSVNGKSPKEYFDNWVY